MSKFKIDYKGLEEFLKTLTYKDFRDSVKIQDGHTRRDIDFFEIDESEIYSSQIIEAGTPFLVDAIGNDLSIIFNANRKYKLPTGRLVYGKFDRTLINDCAKTFGSCLNGYWVIPNRFLQKVK